MKDRKLSRQQSRTRWLILLCFPVILVLIVASISILLPDASLLKTQYPIMSYSKGEAGQTLVDVEFAKSRPSWWTSLEAIPSWVQGAVITSEDWAFFDHQGFDIAQIQDALEDRVRGRGRLRGASTLSQQLVKNVFLKQDRTWSRKLKEALLTLDLESDFSKKEILGFYLNVVEWGPKGIFGIAKASRYYFQKSPSMLNPREAAFLAFLLPNPTRYSESFRKKKLSAFASRQIHRNLQRMKQGHFITETQFEYYSNEPLSFEEHVETSEEAEEELVEETTDSSLVEIPVHGVDEPEDAFIEGNVSDPTKDLE